MPFNETFNKFVLSIMWVVAVTSVDKLCFCAVFLVPLMWNMWPSLQWWHLNSSWHQVMRILLMQKHRSGMLSTAMNSARHRYQTSLINTRKRSGAYLCVMLQWQWQSSFNNLVLLVNNFFNLLCAISIGCEAYITFLFLKCAFFYGVCRLNFVTLAPGSSCWEFFKQMWRQW